MPATRSRTSTEQAEVASEDVKQPVDQEIVEKPQEKELTELKEAEKVNDNETTTTTSSEEEAAAAVTNNEPKEKTEETENGPEKEVEKEKENGAAKDNEVEDGVVDGVEEAKIENDLKRKSEVQEIDEQGPDSTEVTTKKVKVDVDAEETPVEKEVENESTPVVEASA